MNSLGNTLIILGVVLLIFGLLVSGRLAPLGRLPGDILIEKENFSLYIPIVSSIIISLIATVILWFIAK